MGSDDRAYTGDEEIDFVAGIFGVMMNYRPGRCVNRGIERRGVSRRCRDVSQR